jgi:hypothetical protein
MLRFIIRTKILYCCGELGQRFSIFGHTPHHQRRQPRLDSARPGPLSFVDQRFKILLSLTCDVYLGNRRQFGKLQLLPWIA